jgi:hypothetical protein
MGLLRTAARTAVITGTATRVHGRTVARQQAQWAAQQPAAPAPAAPVAPAPPPPAAPPAAAPAVDTSAMIEQLTRLAELKAAGVLTEVEFEVQKARILQGA